jgi:hypothetical protein
MAILQLNYKTQKLNLDQPKFNNPKNSHELRMIRQQTQPQQQQQSRTQVLKILKITNTVCGESSKSSSWIQVGL